MAIKINNTTIIDDSRNIVNAGVVTANAFSGDGSGLTNVSASIGATDNINTTGIITASTVSANEFVGTGDKLIFSPTITSFNPSDGATNISALNARQNIVLTYDQPILVGTGTITLRTGSASGSIVESYQIGISTRATISSQTLTIEPALSFFDYNTDYYVVIPQGTLVNYVEGNSKLLNTYNFITEAGPTVSTFSPANGSTTSSPSDNVVITFNKNIRFGTGTITLRTGSASGSIVESYDVTSSGRLTISGSTLTIDPTSNLNAATTYWVVIPSGAIAGYTGTSTYSFTIGNSVSSFTPTNSSTSQNVTTNITLSFVSAPTRGTGTIELRSGSSTGTLLESFDAASSGRISISGNDWILDPTNSLPNNVAIYLVIPNGGISGYAGLNVGGTSYSFTTAPLPTASISASPNPLTYNGSTTITWSTSNATSVSSNFSVTATSGSTSRSPTRTTTYTVTPVGPGGTGTAASVSVTVNYPALGSSLQGGTLIQRSGGLMWIVAPCSTQLQRFWYYLSHVTTCAQQVTGCTGWFIPTCAQLKSPGYSCRTYWDYTSGQSYWSNTVTPGSSPSFYYCAAQLKFDQFGCTNYSNKSGSQYLGRAFRCVTY